MKHIIGEFGFCRPTARRRYFANSALYAHIGVDAAIFDAALHDPTTHDGVRADHHRVVDAGGFGVPTLFLSERQCLFGPVLVDPSTGPDSLTLCSVVTGMAKLAHVYELQRPKSSADVDIIGRRLRPYLQVRDWVSVNRGEVIDVDSTAERST